jgi:hypothetical protein
MILPTKAAYQCEADQYAHYRARIKYLSESLVNYSKHQNHRRKYPHHDQPSLSTIPTTISRFSSVVKGAV